MKLRSLLFAILLSGCASSSAPDYPVCRTVAADTTYTDGYQIIVLYRQGVCDR